jgi:hypothetical protein
MIPANDNNNNNNNNNNNIIIKTLFNERTHLVLTNQSSMRPSTK